MVTLVASQAAATLTGRFLCVCLWVSAAVTRGAPLPDHDLPGGNSTPIPTSSKTTVFQGRTNKMLQLSALSGKAVQLQKRWKVLPSFFSAVAYGSEHPEFPCTVQSYNPNIRLIGAMLMMLFPIIFYALYQSCFTGPRRCIFGTKQTSIDNVAQNAEMVNASNQ